ncbi:MAG: V-type ATP synthase subunit D [Magnetococcales bacterium]|nr:V-type ATP synthase subunit D [Magnetococcales bacterium]
MEITPTRSALLESRDERLVMREGYRFLDEKRLLLASEIIHQFNRHQELHARYQSRHGQAVAALGDAVSLHGLHGLQVTPVAPDQTARISRQERMFFGVLLVDEPVFEPGDPAVISEAIYPSFEKKQCSAAFSALLTASVALAAISGNLHRLMEEYQRTERRARALEDVILPELDEAIHEMEIRLEELEQEEAVRVRLGRTT